MVVWERLGTTMAGLWSMLVLSAACGGLATESQGKDSGVKDSAVKDSAARDVEAEADARTSTDPCILSASSYDVSCHVDSDCSAVWFGNICSAATCAGCEPNGAINVSATDAYSKNIAAVVDVRVACPCPPPEGTACCDHGTCNFQSRCPR
jgi:hypothetical protein